MPEISPLRPGDPPQIGRYTLTGRIGVGGQGTVYHAVDPSRQPVAVKWIRPDLTGDIAGAQRFLREVAAAKRVAAFCTAQVLDTGVEYDRPYIVSEFIDGPSLQQSIATSGPIRGNALSRLAVGTATALAAIHRAGIVHRDLKPPNVIIGPDGPRVIDFGISRALDTTSSLTSVPIGTPAYMAPEQFLNQDIGPAADMFAWAGTIVFAASGSAPFGNQSLPAVINRILNAQPDIRDIEGRLRDVVASCLDKDPARRPSAQQVIDALIEQSAPEPAPQSTHESARDAVPETAPEPAESARGTAPEPAESTPGTVPEPAPPAPAGEAPAEEPDRTESPETTTEPSPAPGQVGVNAATTDAATDAATDPATDPATGAATDAFTDAATDAGGRAGRPAAKVVAAVCAAVAAVAAAVFVLPQGEDPGVRAVRAHTSLPGSPPASALTVVPVGQANLTPATDATPVTSPSAPRPQGTSGKSGGTTGGGTTFQRKSEPRPGSGPRPPSARDGAVPTTGLVGRELSGVSAVLHEHPSDPVAVAAYRVTDAKGRLRGLYTRSSPGAKFRKWTGYFQVEVSPDGRYAAGLPTEFTDGYDSVDVIDLETGDVRKTLTVRQPLQGTNIQWSRDGRRILLTLIMFTGSTEVTSKGFIVAEVGEPKARVVTVADPAIAHSTFTWDARDKGVVALTGTGGTRGIRFFSAAGTAVRDMAAGAVAETVRADEVGVLFAPSRRSFLTACAGPARTYCVWDAATGRELRRFTANCQYVYAWFGDEHVVCQATGDGDDDAIVVAGLNGQTVRTILTADDATMERKLEISFQFRYS
ncbi:protein kinase domain-containing protein [Microbispora sp. H13382]|uniref:protein kinase domain-containing protein n=1 Tax=Microbispora sp. H13382 TaxID=2729112 RepID=UPI002873D0BB|nr:protein kinase [Microbispora sp. H13382]